MIKCNAVVMMNVAALPLMKKRNAIAWKQVHQECVGEVKRRSPHDTGNNERSINPEGAVNVEGDIDVNPDNIKLDVFGTSGYSGFLEVGTRHMGAQPYICLLYTSPSPRDRS